MKAFLYPSISIVILFLSFDLFGQNDDSHKTFSTVICNYNLPLNKNGLSVTSFNVTPTIRIQRHEKNAEIFLNIKSSQGTSANPNPSFTYSYNFMGKKYGNESVGKDAFGSIQAGTLTYEVLVTYGSQSWGWKKVDGDDNPFGPIVADAKASEVMVNVRIAGLYFSGTSTIENRILALSKAKMTSTVKPSANPLSSNAGNSSDQNPGTNNKSGMQNSNARNTASINSPTATSTGRPIQSGSALLSDKVKVNGAYVQVFQQNGAYYMVNADGTQHQTTKYAYDQVNAAAKSSSTNNNTTSKTSTTTGGLPPNTSGNDPLANYNPATTSYNEEKVIQDVVSGVFDLFTPSAEQSERNMQELARKMQSKVALDKALEGKKEQAKNGDDQSYYDIYSAYEYSFKKDARYYKRLAYSTGNASVFKEEKRLENNSPKGLFVGLQSGEVSLAGLSFLETTNNFGFFMSFRMSVKKVDGDPFAENKDPKNRDEYIDRLGNTYTFLSEASKSEQGRMLISLGSSYHIYKPLFIYAGVGFGTINTFSYQKKVNTSNIAETVKVDESFLGGSTDAGIIIKVGRLIALNGGISLMNLKYPEYVAGISFNFFPEK